MTNGERLIQGLTDEQHRQLLTPINDRRVKRTQGNSYLEGWDVIAHLNRIFGFGGWDDNVTSEQMLFEEHGRDNKKGWYVAYRVALQLTIRSVDGSIVTVKTGANTGQADNQPDRGSAHDLAYKAAHTNALKRAASKLGDQFGLSLYDDGNLGTVVGRTLVWSEPGQQQDRTDVEQIAADAVTDSGQTHPEPDPEPSADVTNIGEYLATTKPADEQANGKAAGNGDKQKQPESIHDARRRLNFTQRTALELLGGPGGAMEGLKGLNDIPDDELPDAILALEVAAKTRDDAKTSS